MDRIEAESNRVVSGETEAQRGKVPYAQPHWGRARKGGLIILTASTPPQQQIPSHQSLPKVPEVTSGPSACLKGDLAALCHLALPHRIRSFLCFLFCCIGTYLQHMGSLVEACTVAWDHIICRPDQGLKLGPPALGAESLSHWTAREFPGVLFTAVTNLVSPWEDKMPENRKKQTWESNQVWMVSFEAPAPATLKSLTTGHFSFWTNLHSLRKKENCLTQIEFCQFPLQDSSHSHPPCLPHIATPIRRLRPHRGTALASASEHRSTCCPPIQVIIIFPSCVLPLTVHL